MNDTIQLGCLDCESVFEDIDTANGCPVCGSSEYMAMESLLSEVIQNRLFLQELGVSEEE